MEKSEDKNHLNSMEINLDKNEYENLSTCSQVEYSLENQEDSQSESSETTLPSSETDAILAMEDAQEEEDDNEGAAREDDAMSTSSEATLPSSEAEAQIPNSEDILEVKMDVEAEDNVERDSTRRSTKKNNKAVAANRKDDSSQLFNDRPTSSPSSSNGDVTTADEENSSIANQLSQGGSYPCARCQRTFWSRPNLEAHERVHSGERPFDCSACGRTFAQACHLRNHEIAAHGRAGPPRAFTCDACGRAFGRHSALAAHARVHAPRLDDSAPATSPAAAGLAAIVAPAIDAAAAMAAVASAAVNGGNTHPNTQLVNASLPSGGGLALTPSGAADAAATPQNSGIARSSTAQNSRPAGPVTCDVCGKTLSHRCSLARHMRTHTAAPRPRPHRCSRCAAAFGTPLQLADHERRHHTGERPFACARCTRRFHSKAHLKYHERSHDGARPFRCDFCHKAFMSQFGLTRHRRVHTGDFRYKCDECPDAFVSRGQLLAHARNHAAAGGARRPFQCPLCTASFVQRGLLTLHLRKHTGEQPFRCGRCQLGFPHRRLLVAHQAVCREDLPPPPQPEPLLQKSLLPLPPSTGEPPPAEPPLINPALTSPDVCLLAPGASTASLPPPAPLPAAANITFTPGTSVLAMATSGSLLPAPAVAQSPPSVALMVPPSVTTPAATPALMPPATAQAAQTFVPSVSSIPNLLPPPCGSSNGVVTPMEGFTLNSSISSPLPSPTPLGASSAAVGSPPRPRLLLVTVKSPEHLSGGEMDGSPKMAPDHDSLMSTSLIVKMEQQGGETSRKVTFKIDEANLTDDEDVVPKLLAAAFENQNCMEKLPGTVIVKMADGTIGLDDDGCSSVDDVPEEAWRELDALSRREEVDLGPMPPGAVLVKIKPEGMGSGEIATMMDDEDQEAIHSLSGVPLLIEQSEGSPWPIPTAVVTVKIEDSDNEDCWQDSCEDEIEQVKIIQHTFDNIAPS